MLEYWNSLMVTFVHPFREDLITIFIIFTGVSTAVLASAAIRQCKDKVILHRAYVSVLPAGVVMFRNRDAAVSQVDLFNSGRLPATHVRWFIEHTFHTNGHWNPEKIDIKLVVGSGNVIAPHAKMRQSGNEIPVGRNALTLQEGLFLYVRGVVTYRDGFHWRKRTTSFCHRYNCVNVPSRLHWGFPVMDGDSARNHQFGNHTT